MGARFAWRKNKDDPQLAVSIVWQWLHEFQQISRCRIRRIGKARRRYGIGRKRKDARDTKDRKDATYRNDGERRLDHVRTCQVMPSE